MGAKGRRPRVRIRRAYDPPAADDRYRILVDRVWPRGKARNTLKLDAWLPEVGPSDTLRRWFGHDPRRWETFRARYADELENSDAFRALQGWVRKGPVTLVYGARDVEHNQAVVLRDLLIGA